MVTAQILRRRFWLPFAGGAPRRRGVLRGRRSSPEGRPARTALLAGGASYADSARGRCPLDSRNFFEKKLTKSFIIACGRDGGLAAALFPVRLGYKA